MLDAAEQMGLEEAATQPHSAFELEVTGRSGQRPDCFGGMQRAGAAFGAAFGAALSLKDTPHSQIEGITNPTHS